MSETPEEYLARRLAISVQRQEQTPHAEIWPDDTHGKAGCFDCEWLAFGTGAAGAAAEHHTAAKHQIWVIRPPME